MKSHNKFRVAQRSESKRSTPKEKGGKGSGRERRKVMGKQCRAKRKETILEKEKGEGRIRKTENTKFNR